MDFFDKLDDVLDTVTIPKDILQENESSIKVGKSVSIKNHNSKVLEKIISLGWTVLDAREFEDASFYEVSEEFDCEYNGWSFVVRKLEDIDIEEGIWAISNLEKNSRIINIYVDIGCRNTGEAKLKMLLKLLECESEEDFYNKEYSKYKNISIPGFHCILVQYNPEKPRIVVSVKKDDDTSIDMYLVLFQGWMSDLKVVVTNDCNWDVNSYNRTSSNGKIAYYVDDFNALEVMFSSLYEHVSGRIGLLQHDGQYFNNRNIEKLVGSLKDATNKTDLNNGLVKYDIFNNWDYRGYTNAVREKYPLPNKYEGIEISIVLEALFGDGSSWTHGKPHICYAFIVVCDKKKSEQIKLRVVAYTSELGMFVYKDDNAEEDFHDGNLLLWDAVKTLIDEEYYFSPDEVKDFIVKIVSKTAAKLGIAFDESKTN